MYKYSFQILLSNFSMLVLLVFIIRLFPLDTIDKVFLKQSGENTLFPLYKKIKLDSFLRADFLLFF